jgi:hypothetical protein
MRKVGIVYEANTPNYSLLEIAILFKILILLYCERKMLLCVFKASSDNYDGCCELSYDVGFPGTILMQVLLLSGMQ